ncbi:MAG: MBL fold metallo-hydrolase [Cytophagales bacterium]|nr:MBL fold metallo-hydrolase [Cytophagales bacterium]
MKIEQFYDGSLAHASYAILSNGEMAVIDPGRNAQPYYEFARLNNAKIVAVIETHPHADFVSSHLEISKKTGATIYVSKLLGADYPHCSFDEGETIKLGDVTLKSLNTPGHSPDSISIVLEDEHGKDYAVFTGDTLFIGDVGRPDLREKAGHVTAKREGLARDMYRSTREKLIPLDDDVLVYPAHGAGSLCGRHLSPDLSSTMGKEKSNNYALQPMSEDEFTEVLLKDQPFVPKYFGYAVEQNKKGARDLEESVKAVPRIEFDVNLAGFLIIDTRPQQQFKAGHIKGAINIADLEGDRFETWLGSIIGPEEKFYLTAENEEALEKVIRRIAKIGYETNIKAAFVNPDNTNETNPSLDLEHFKSAPDSYTVIDIRNESEARDSQLFSNSLNVPLPQLRERIDEIPLNKPIVVHCAGGYRSAAGSCIIRNHVKDVVVYDLGEVVMEFGLE